MNDKKTITIGLLWHSVTSDNLGVGALTESQISICTSAAKKANVNLQFIIFGTTGGCSYAPMEAAFKIGGKISIRDVLFGKSSFLKDLDQCDLILDIGEGDSFTDVYGIRRFISLAISKIAVLAKRKTLILSPQTIGPFDHWIARKIAMIIMKRCQRVYTRDGLSSIYLTHLGVRNNIAEATDVAFRLPYIRPEHDKNDTKIRIGVNVSGLLFSGGYTQNNQFALSLDYPRLVRDLLHEWVKNPDYEIWLIPHVISTDLPIEDDRIAINILREEFSEVVKCAPEFQKPSEAKSFISGMDFMTGARMHACIAAFSSGVPVVPLAYSRKFNGLFSSLNYEWIADGKTMNNEEAYKKIMDGFSNREQLKQEIKQSLISANTKIAYYEQDLCDLFIVASEKYSINLGGQHLL